MENMQVGEGIQNITENKTAIQLFNFQNNPISSSNCYALGFLSMYINSEIQ